MKCSHPFVAVSFMFLSLLATDSLNAKPLDQGQQDAAAQNGHDEEKPVGPVIKDGEAQIADAFKDSDRWIRHDLWVETDFDSDGDEKLDRMHVDVTRPYQTEYEGLKVAVVYVSSPYFAGTAPGTDFFWNPRQEIGQKPTQRTVGPEVKRESNRLVISKRHTSDWVPRGFAVVHSSSPGTGLSDGCPTIGGKNESLAPKAVIDWLCGRAKGFTSVDGDDEVKAFWSTRKVGMTGTSYNGTIPLAAATTGVDGLEAIVPVAPNTSYYHYYRSNGLVRAPGGYQGEDIDVLYDYIHSGNPDRDEFCDCKVRDEEMAKGMARDTGDYNEFWAGRDYLNQLDDVKAAVLMSHGFNDWNVMPEHSYRIYDALNKNGVPTQIYYHQDGHGGPPPLTMINRWFTHYLLGIDNGVEKDAKAWIVREGDKPDKPTAYDDYPNPEASPIALYLSGNSPKRGNLSLDRKAGGGKEKLIDNFSFSGESLSQAETTEHRLMYVTPELKDSVHLSGLASLKIRMASSKPAANLSAWIVSLPWDESKNAKITDNIITRGWADPQNHRSLTEGEPLVPGQFYELSFDFQPDDQVIAKGQQIGLMIFSSDRNFTLQPEPGTELTIDLDTTQLTLPIVGGESQIRKCL
ncbi:Xaa-Pro dipeptidyl-peptidase [Rubripirellula tenax]|uniref:Xaa-Pro dipeptidyl-peptidase n=1 Tax=Rubripirellula tenax TaxID=2528015 RepID=A0A5C6EXF7_9BACT|nr:Xaa-Pro dipeptidyl-peptidase [Rubripirellula tenax]TWU54313.1 Xaa-Pro dipeptidyl-peptidase [Rubripirellula tenax]